MIYRAVWNIVDAGLPIELRREWCVAAVEDHQWSVEPTSSVQRVVVSIDTSQGEARFSLEPWFSCSSSEDIGGIVRRKTAPDGTVGLLLRSQGSLEKEGERRAAVLALMLMSDESMVEAVRLAGIPQVSVANQTAFPAYLESLAICLSRGACLGITAT